MSDEFIYLPLSREDAVLYLKVFKDYQLRLRLGGKETDPRVASDIKFLEHEMVEKRWTVSREN